MAFIKHKVFSSEALFDDVGHRYEPAFAGLRPQLDSIQWLKIQLESQKPANILDIGCGTGRPVCLALVDAGHDVVGIDISTAMIEVAKRNVPGATFIKTDIGDYTVEPSTYDAVTVYFSMIASVTQENIKTYITRIYNWLKPGGLFVFATVPSDAENQATKWMGRSIIVSGLSAEHVTDHVSRVGFEILHTENSTFLPRGVEAGLCKEEEVWEEPHLFLYAKK